MANLIDVVNNLLDCLCQGIVDGGLPDVCFCGVVPGEAAVQDYSGDCDTACGMAWVRVASIYPAAAVGVASDTPGNCGKGLGADLELGIMRCISSGQPDGSPPTPTELGDAVALQALDALVMRTAVVCCDSLGEHDYVLGTYTPVGPTGGLVGGTWTLAVAVD